MGRVGHDTQCHAQLRTRLKNFYGNKQSPTFWDSEITKYSYNTTLMNEYILPIRYIADPKNAALWEGKGSKFDALWDRKGLNLHPFPSHNAAFFGSAIYPINQW